VEIAVCGADIVLHVSLQCQQSTMKRPLSRGARDIVGYTIYRVFHPK
jgi:hypothetical protein